MMSDCDCSGTDCDCGGTDCDCGGGSFIEPPSNHLNKNVMRKWWHDILRNYRHFDCYAIFLAFPSDRETIRYLTEFGNDAEIVSGENCLVITLSKTGFRFSGFNNRWNEEISDDDRPSVVEQIRKKAINEYVTSDFSNQIAQLFQVDVAQFPCLLLFRDIRSPQHFAATLKGMKAEEISNYVRILFSIVRKAVKEKEDIFVALDRHKNNDNLLKSGKSILTKSSGLAGKTFEVAIEALINSILKP
jgi:hypothetical protein